MDISTPNLSRIVRACNLTAMRYDNMAKDAATPSWAQTYTAEAADFRALAREVADEIEARRALERDMIRHDCYGQG